MVVDADSHDTLAGKPEPRVGKHESELPEGCPTLGVGKNTTSNYMSAGDNIKVG